MSRPHQNRKVLFLCTGNYYRSRFAEILFNHLASQKDLGWNADSCALDVSRGRLCNIGPISKYAIAGLQERGISLPAEQQSRFPRQVTDDDLRAATVVIALKEAEHRPLVESRYAAFAGAVEYWHIHDLDKSTPQDALAQIESQIRQLLQRLEGSEPAAA